MRLGKIFDRWLGFRPVAHGHGWVEYSFPAWLGEDAVRHLAIRLAEKHRDLTGCEAHWGYCVARRVAWLWDDRGTEAVSPRVNAPVPEGKS